MKTIQVRISDDDKKEVERILSKIGLDIPTAVRVFLKTVIRERRIPFPLELSECEDDID